MNVSKSSKFTLAAVVCMMTLAACSNGGSSSGASPSASTSASGSASPSAEPKNTEPANLVIYSNSGDSEDSWNERFGNALKAKFPNYTFKYIPKTKEVGIKELLTGGTTIDLYWDSIGSFASTLLDNDLQFDMTPLMKKYNVDLSAVEPTVADSVKLIDPQKVYGIPVFNNNLVLYYNKDLFDKFGVSYPKDGLTWSEATQLSNSLTRNDGGKLYAGLSGSDTHMLLMNQLSIPFIDEKTLKPTLDTDERWKQLFDTVFMGPAGAPGYKEYMNATTKKLPYRNEFLTDRSLAMFVWLSSIVSVFPKEFSEMNWDMVSMPTFDKQPGVGSQAYPTYFAVTKVSKQQEQAMQVIQYLISPEMQLKLSKLGVMPVLNSDDVKKAYGTESAVKDKNLKAVFYNKFAPIPAKTKFESMALTPYAKTIPKIVLGSDYNTEFRATAEDLTKKIEAAKQ